LCLVRNGQFEEFRKHFVIKGTWNYEINVRNDGMKYLAVFLFDNWYIMGYIIANDNLFIRNLGTIKIPMGGFVLGHVLLMFIYVL